MMKFTCGNARKFKTILKTICKITPELVINASIEGLRFYGMSSNHLIVLSGIMNTAFFERYNCKPGENITICLESEILGNVLSRINSSDEIEMEVKVNRIIFSLCKPYQRKFIINKKATWERPLKIKNFMGKAIKVINPNIFHQIISDASKVADEITIKATRGLLSFIARNSSCSFFYQQRIAGANIKENITVTVLTPLLTSLIPLARESDAITLKLAKNGPLAIDFEFEENKASFTFVISSRT